MKLLFSFVVALQLLGSANAHQVLKEPALNVNVEEAANLGLSVELMAKFHAWSDYHEKSYESHEEKMKRLKIWVQNDGMFSFHNSLKKLKKSFFWTPATCDLFRLYCTSPHVVCLSHICICFFLI